MNVSRYTLAATVSIAVHAGIFSQFEVTNALAMPVGSQSTSIAVQFVQPASQPIIKKETTANSSKAISAVKTAPSSPVADTKPSQSVAKAKPVKAPSKNSAPKSATLPKKNIETIKKAAPKEVTTNQVNAPKPKTKVKPPVVDDATKPSNQLEQQNDEKLKPLAKNGVADTPVLIEQPNFLAPPTKPKYPRLAQKRGLEGTAMYEIWLDEDGSQIKQNLLSSSGAAMLDKAALDAIKKWKFSPRTVNGVSMAHRVQIPVRFKLD